MNVKYPFRSRDLHLSTLDKQIILAMQSMGCLSKITHTASGSPAINWQAVFVIGGAGAGKSRNIKKYLNYLQFEKVDPDEFKKRHPNFDPLNPEALHPWSKIEADRQLDRILDSGSGQSLLIEGTGKTKSSILSKMQRCRDAGYKIYLVYILVPIEVSYFRNRNRAAHGERFVPERIIPEQYASIEKNFYELRHFVDKFKIILNYTQADIREAEEDLKIYPPPQLTPPPRPGDPDYGKDTKVLEEEEEEMKSLASVLRKVAHQLILAAQEDAEDTNSLPEVEDSEDQETEDSSDDDSPSLEDITDLIEEHGISIEDLEDMLNEREAEEDLEALDDVMDDMEDDINEDLEEVEIKESFLKNASFPMNMVNKVISPPFSNPEDVSDYFMDFLKLYFPSEAKRWKLKLDSASADEMDDLVFSDMMDAMIDLAPEGYTFAQNSGGEYGYWDEEHAPDAFEDYDDF